MDALESFYGRDLGPPCLIGQEKRDPKVYIPRSWSSRTEEQMKGKKKAIELEVPVCCEKCADKITDALIELEGVDSVTVEEDRQKVTITGSVDPAKVLIQARTLFRKSRFWSETFGDRTDEAETDDKKRWSNYGMGRFTVELRDDATSVGIVHLIFSMEGINRGEWKKGMYIDGV